MALLRAAQARARPVRSPSKKNTVEPETPIQPGSFTDDGEQDAPQGDENDDNDVDDDEQPPTKRLRTSRTNSQPRTRWIPGGRGGGGRRIDSAADASLVTPRANTGERRKARSSRRRGETTGRRTTGSRLSTRPTRTRTAGRPRYSTAAAAAAATHSDGYKPREERGWEEYHPDLDLDSAFAVIPSELVDGIVRPPQNGTHDGDVSDLALSPGASTPTKRRPGRPHRTQSSMLQSLLTPEAPKFVPLPGPNPRERLTLPKPSYRIIDPFRDYEEEFNADGPLIQSLLNVGYQDTDVFVRPNHMIRQTEGSADEDLDLLPQFSPSGGNSAIGTSGVGRVEYDMDEQDARWLEAVNKQRLEEGAPPVKPAIFEITMTKLEKEWHALEKRIPKPNPKAPQTQRPRSSSAAAVNGEPGSGEEPDSKCAICDDGDCENANAIVFCDGCDLAVHQECYGVPYIPEGQWLCRKCQLVGNARPSCIFCPNEGGAFKQTNNSKWAHLLCATWIPEVTIGNPSLMEPITDVEKVPNSRWKLGCYICKQDMGASIQCSDGRCYEPFHLTCARQAGLFLRMKLGGGQNTLMDPSQLRAYCHKHSPVDWKAEHRTDRAFEKAVKYFRHHFHGQIWADSKSSALAITDSHDTYSSDRGVQKVALPHRKGPKPKSIWRLPSGAPVVPEVMLKTVVDSLSKFSLAKKSDFVLEACKYWTLKREARRGAALLKRLQLQMETFSSFEVTRRDYKAQGAAGRARLDRRIEFAELLAKDLQKIKDMCEETKRREALKLEDAQLLCDIVNIIYTPLVAILRPVVEKAMSLDRKGFFTAELTYLGERVEDRSLGRVQDFSDEFVSVFGEESQSIPSEQLSESEQREKRSLAKRISKMCYPLLASAVQCEGDLLGTPTQQQLKDLSDVLLDRRSSLVGSLEYRSDNKHAVLQDGDVHMTDDSSPKKDAARDVPVDSIERHSGVLDVHVATDGNTPDSETLAPRAAHSLADHTPPASTNGHLKHDKVSQENTVPEHETLQPPTPPISTKGANHNPISHGGVPFWAESYEPCGTVLYEKKWDGKDILRELSDLSEIADEDLLDTMDDDDDIPPSLRSAQDAAISVKAASKPAPRRKRKSLVGRRRIR